MPISAYTGLPRHGKSYGVVENVIIPALEANKLARSKGKPEREIWSNIPMNDDVCLKRYGSTVTAFNTKDLIDNPKWFDDVLPKGALVILDELWRLWPSGLKANQALESHKSFLAEHGHRVGENGKAIEIIFVTQDLSQIASFARTLVETTYRVEKLSKVGLENRYRVDVFSGAITGKPPIGKRDREILGKFKKTTFEIYISHTQSDAGAGDETRTDNRFNILKGGKVKSILFGLLFLLFALYFLTRYFMQNSDLVEHDDVIQHTKPLVREPLPLKSSSIVESDKVESDKSRIEPQVVNHVVSNLDIVSKADDVIFLGTYVQEVKGVLINKHIYKLIVDNSFTILNQNDLVNLGYSVEILSDCMTIIKGYSTVNYAMCHDSDLNYNGFIGSVVTSVN